MQPGHMIRYDFQKSSGTISTDEEYITIGFSTQVKRGILMQIIGGTPERPEYITVEMNNNGIKRLPHCRLTRGLVMP